MANIYICNNQFLIIEYYKKLIKIVGFIIDSLLLRRKKIKFQLIFKDGSKKIILNLQNIYYFLSSLSNFISLKLLNNSGIIYNNKNKILY